MSNNRRKGHNWERKIVADLKKIGFEYARTSRSASRILDDCGVDVANVPLSIQAKAGYANARPRYDQLYKNTQNKLKENFPPTSEQFDFPFVLAYKLDGRKKEHMQLTFDYEFGLQLLKLYYEFLLRGSENKPKRAKEMD
jgi:hypothetical protein